MIGALKPHWAGVALATDFDEFDTPTMNGLARVVPGTAHLEILAISAKHPGRGDCGRFFAECMKHYDIVRVWDVLNGDLAEMLERRGFKYVTRWMDREMVDGYEWSRSALGTRR